MTAETDRPGASSPVDLAREQDFALGALGVSPSAREILRDGEREQLEPRVMQVLVALFRADGRVVSRDELIARCWEGRIVGEDAINRAIGRLRRLSEADQENSFQIETIPRVGYRLRPAAAVPQARTTSPPPSGAPPAPPAPPPPAAEAPPPLVRQGFLLRHRLAITGVVALAIAAVAAWFLWPERQWTVESGRPFIDSLALEDDPAFSPNGTTLAYSSGPDGGQRKIFIRNLTGGDGIKVTSDDFDDTAPSWSSDGGHIAYVGLKPGEPCHLMVATVPAGAAREVGRCTRAASSSIAWQPSTNFLYFIEHGALSGDSIMRLDLDSGAEVPVVQMPRLNQQISDLHCSPDGKWLAYILARTIVIRDLSNGAERQFAPLERGSSRLAWALDSRAVLARISGGIGSEIRAFPIDGSPSYSVYATAMPLGSLAAGPGVLATVTYIGRLNLARPTTTETAEPDVVDPANGSTWSPSFAPDGTLAFLSNRSGSNVVWIQRPGAAATQLFDGGLAPLFQVRFSPDGTRLAVVTNFADNVTIRIMTLGGTGLRSFSMPSLGIGLPTWTPDGKAVLVFDRHDKRTWRIAVDDPRQRSPFAPPHWVGVAARPQGTFAIRADKPGIWRIDGAPQRMPSLLAAKYPAYYNPPLTFRGDDVLVPEYPGTTPRLFAQPLSGGADRLIGYLPGAAGERNSGSALAVNPRTGEILYTATIGHDTNIDLLTLAKH